MLLASREKIGSTVNLCLRDLICTIWRRPKSSLRSALLMRIIPTVLDREKRYLIGLRVQPSPILLLPPFPPSIGSGDGKYGSAIGG